jgi:hypothetical protein
MEAVITLDTGQWDGLFNSPVEAEIAVDGTLEKVVARPV